MSTEGDLLYRARRSDQAALAEIYDQYSPALYRYAVRLLGHPEMAEDCVAETFSRFLRALRQRGGPERHLRAYLYRVAHNWVTDHYRRQGPPEEPLEAGLHDDADEADPPGVVEESLERQRVRKALAHLTPEQRQVIVLRFLEGWSNDDVAQALGKPVGAVKALQHRGLAALRRILLES